MKRIVVQVQQPMPYGQFAPQYGQQQAYPQQAYPFPQIIPVPVNGEDEDDEDDSTKDLINLLGNSGLKRDVAAATTVDGIKTALTNYSKNQTLGSLLGGKVFGGGGSIKTLLLFEAIGGGGLSLF